MEIKIRRFIYFIVVILIPSTLWFFCGRKRNSHSPIANAQKIKKSSVPSSTYSGNKSSKSTKKKKRKSLLLEPTQLSDDTAVLKTCSWVMSLHSPPLRAEAERSIMVSSAEWWSRKTTPRAKSVSVLELSRTQSGKEDVFVEISDGDADEVKQKANL